MASSEKAQNLHDSSLVRLELAKVLKTAFVTFIIVSGAWLSCVLFFFERASHASRVLLVTDRVRIHELEARRAEKDFLLRTLADPAFYESGESVYLAKHTEEVHALEKLARDLRGMVDAPETAAVDGLLESVSAYRDGFKKLAGTQLQAGASARNLDVDSGVYGDLRAAIHRVEPAVVEVQRWAGEAYHRAQRDLKIGLVAASAIMAALLLVVALFAHTARVRARQLSEANRRLEEEHRQLLQAERLAAIGQMMTGLAHESRNALQRSQACLDMLKHRVEDAPKALELVQRIQSAQDHIHRLYEEVKQYAAPLRLDRQECRLDHLVAKVWDDLAVERGSGSAVLRQEASPQFSAARADSFAMERVFRNILENSLSACGGSAEIDVSWRQAELDGAPAVAGAFRDNGPGLNVEQRERIFEPFFTTKTKGTGLGMAISKRLIEAHGGKIEVGPGGPGAEIVVTIPKVGGPGGPE